MAAPFRVITPRKNEKTGKTHWARIGAAFKRDNGGFSVVLDALPIGGELLIVPPDDENKRERQPGEDDVPY